MMRLQFSRSTGVMLVLLNLLSAAALVQAFRIYHAQEATDTLSKELEDKIRSLQKTQATLQEQMQEMTFLQNVATLVPQDKHFVRTQQAMATEVTALREKVERRIGRDLHILVDTQANKLYVKQGVTLLWQADCSVGKGGVLLDKKTGRRWEFVTPRGQFEIRDKLADPIWTKPDWAFVETDEPVPPPGDPVRQAKGELGAYVLNLGDGYLIHGTKNEALLGRPASHGCVRLGHDDLQKIYELLPKGTRVFIY